VNQTANRERDRFGDRLVEASGLVPQNGEPPPLRYARRAPSVMRCWRLAGGGNEITVAEQREAMAVGCDE
jgi:hypothetical protein